MAESNIIQMHDYAGNNQYPVTLASLVYDEDGETVGKKLALLLDWFEWGDEKETSVKTKYPFWSEKQLSAGGIGEESGSGEGGIGTITGIKVNGEVWNEPDEFGVLTIPNYPTSLEWADIAGRPTHLSQFTDDVVAGNYLPLTGGTMGGHIVMGKNAIVFNLDQSDTWANPQNSGLRILNTTGASAIEGLSTYAVALSVSGYYGFQLASDAGLSSFYYRNTVTGTNGAWKQIAFTDSTVEAAKRIVNDNGDFVIYRSGSGNIIVGDNNGAGDTHLIGNKIYLRYGGSSTYGLILNSYGNVTIGDSDLAGSDTRLYVKGLICSYTLASLSSLSLNRNPNSGLIYNDSNLAFAIENSASAITFNEYRGDGSKVGVPMAFSSGGNVGIGTEVPDEMLHVAGNIRLKNASNYGCYLKFGDKDYCCLYEDSDDHLNIYADKGIALLTNGKGVTTDTSLTIGSAVLSWDSVNNALKIEGNVYTTGQLSVGGVGTEVQKVFDIAAESNTTTANQPYTATLTHNLNTYDLAVVVYEVTLQSDGITETLTQVLADVTLTDENKVTVYFASRKTGKKYRIVIVG